MQHNVERHLLALALILFCFPVGRRAGQQQLFSGCLQDCTEKVCHNCLSKAVFCHNWQWQQCCCCQIEGCESSKGKFKSENIM
jgi:hypothetical protein